MSIKKIQKFDYYGFSCMARFYEKKYQGVIWLSENDKGRIPPEHQAILKARIVGTSLEDVIQQIRELIDYVDADMSRDSEGAFDPLFRIPSSNIRSPRYDENGIYYLGDYHPKSGTKHDAYSKEILKLKEQESEDYFYKWFENVWPDPIFYKSSFACVPSSNSDTEMNGIQALVRGWVCFEYTACLGDCYDLTTLFKRHTSIKPAHLGGGRSIEVHMNSIKVRSAATEAINRDVNLLSAPVFIFDDVATSGNSLLACRKIAAAAGFRDIHLCALGKTKRYRT